MTFAAARVRRDALAYTVGMQRGVIVRGRLRGQVIELDEPIREFDGAVEVFVRATDGPSPAPDLLDVIAALPPGTRTREDIDRQLAADRDDWAGRG